MKSKLFAAALAAVISVSALASASASADWVKTDRGYFYKDENGDALTGWQEIDGKTYCFGSDGTRRTGWWKMDGSLYYFSSKGVMQTGKTEIGGKPYDFGSDGRLVRDIALTVNGKALDNAPAAYRSKGIIMVPLENISAALGYSCTYDENSGKAVVDDDYIQNAEVTAGSDQVKFVGELKVIDMSREVTMEAEAAVKDGVVFVPLSFFEEFMNDVSFDGSSADVSPSMVYLD